MNTLSCRPVGLLNFRACCCLLCLAVAPQTFGDFVGVEAEIRTDLTICQDTDSPNIEVPLSVCDVYAVFDDPADRLLSVGNNGIGTTDSEGFYQHPFNVTPISPPCDFIAVLPDLVCDSFVTIGLECGPPPPGTDRTAVDVMIPCPFNPEWPNCIGGWFNAEPSNGQRDAGTYPDLRVLLARLSVAEGHDVSGSLGVFVRIGDAEPPLIQLFQDLEFECAGGPPSECDADCPADVDDDGSVGASDLATLLGAWGPCDNGPCLCIDADEDQQIGAADLAALLGSWGPCP